MIEFIYIFVILFYLLLLIAILAENDFFAIFSGIGLMICGIYLITNGVSGIDTFITEVMGTVNIGIGAYIFLTVTGTNAVDIFNDLSK